MRMRTFFLFVSPLMLLSAVLGFLVADARARPADPAIYWSDPVVREMRSLVEQDYVDEVPAEQARRLFFAACKAYVSGLDPYCEFYTPDELRSFEEETKGEFGGVGILGRSSKEGLRVRGARIGDPAWEVGIRAGDLVLTVDGVGVSGEGDEALLPRLRGKPGSSVRVRWTPAAGGAPREADVRRSEIKYDSVVGVRMLDVDAGIGYLRISRFQENTAADAAEALRRLKEQGARAFVLDLRGDYGGVLPAAVAVADLFLPVPPFGPHSELVVLTRGRSGVDTPVQSARRDPGDDVTSPLVLLVDGSTASAAEVLAGALQDQMRAVLVGERTYGKFLVQRIVPLQQEDVAVRITTARYYTPLGRNLQRDDSKGVRGGLVPDAPVSVGDEDRRAVAGWLEQQVGIGWDLVPEEGAPGLPARDPILHRAMDVLRGAAGPAEAGR